DQDVLVLPSGNCDVDQLRGIMMYLVLNSANLDGSQQDSKLAQWNPQCVHLLHQLPAPLAQLVTVSLAVDCGLLQQFYELLACAPHWLGAQYIDCLNETLSHLVSGSLDALPLLGGTLSAVSWSLSYRPSAAAGFVARPEHLLQAAMRLLQRQLLDNEERLRRIPSKLGRQRYLGEAMQQLLDVLLQTLAALRSPPPQLPAYFAIYALRASPLQEEQLDQPPKLLLFAGKLMDALQRLLPLVSVDVYMTWHELPSGQLLFSLQTHIGNQCAQLLQQLELQDVALSKHSLRGQLSNFAKAALSFEQRLEQLSLGELLSLLDESQLTTQPQQLLAALNQLLQRPIALGNDECIDSLAKHVQLLGLPQALLMLDYLQQALQAKQLELEEEDELDYIDYDELFGELLSKLLCPIFKALPTVEQKLQLLVKRDQLQLLDKLSFKLGNERIGFFNGLSYQASEFPWLQFLDLCYEQPAEAWLSLAQLGMTHREFGQLYCHVATACGAHAAQHLDYTLHQLLQDEALLTHNSSSIALDDDLLLQLYDLPLKLLEAEAPLDGLDQLQLAQRNYLSAIAIGLEKFADAQNYAALGRLGNTLLQLRHVEQRLEQKQPKLVKLGNWRVSNWKLTFELIATLDKLRGQLANYDPQRCSVLDQLMEYYVQNMPH
ncbi:hypothetical protein KR044_008081, partial [Drosophila immigrans]